MKTMQLDGITIEVGDGNASEVIAKHIKTLNDTVADVNAKLAAATAQVTTLTKDRDEAIAKSATEISTRDAKIATLEQQVKDAALTPAQIDKLVTDRKVVADKARVAMGDKASTLVVDGKTDDEIRSQVVTAKLGDTCKGWNADQIRVSFDTLTASIDLSKLTDGRGGVLDTARAFSSPSVTTDDAREAAYAARDKNLENAWKGPTAGAA